MQQILTFGRSGMAGGHRVDVGRVAGEVARLLEVALPPGVRIEVTVRGECTVLGSGVQVHQVLQNLVTNACLAVEEGGGMVRVEVVRHSLPAGDRVQVRVVDNGVGMSAETRERVFDPYFSTRGGARGTGLGLPIVRRIVQELDGQITVSSVLGQGSVFSVELPAAPEAAVGEPERGEVAGVSFLVAG